MIQLEAERGEHLHERVDQVDVQQVGVEEVAAGAQQAGHLPEEQLDVGVGARRLDVNTASAEPDARGTRSASPTVNGVAVGDGALGERHGPVGDVDAGHAGVW